MLTIALTGNIGSGKTTVANLFQELNVPHIDSDQIARNVVQPGTEALAKITQYFGSNILSADNTLNRRALREKIFQHPEARIWLENLLHPLIRETAQQQLQVLDVPYAIYVVPLLVGKREQSPFIQRVLLVDTPLEQQKLRVVERDQISPTDVDAILATQATRDALLHVADDVIMNNASLNELKQQVLALHEKYLRLCLDLQGGLNTANPP